VGVRGSPQRSSDVFQRCSNRSTSGSAASVAFCPDKSSGVAPSGMAPTPRFFPRRSSQARVRASACSHRRHHPAKARGTWHPSRGCPETRGVRRRPRRRHRRESPVRVIRAASSNERVFRAGRLLASGVRRPAAIARVRSQRDAARPSHSCGPKLAARRRGSST
jgi:hypothetical protein